MCWPWIDEAVFSEVFVLLASSCVSVENGMSAGVLDRVNCARHSDSAEWSIAMNCD
jgi:hypothetical protein